MALVYEGLSKKVIGACIEVHRNLGPGLLEGFYQRCLAFELEKSSIQFEQEVPIRLSYKGVLSDEAYRADFIIEEILVLELKSVESILKVHEAQLLTYLKASKLKVGLLVNFNELKVKDGIIRMVN
jgi:GxxExxY protein